MTLQGKVHVSLPGEGAAHHIGLDKFLTKGPARDGTESFSVVEYEGAAGQPGPPSHIHRTFDEAWYILEGNVAFRSNANVIEARRGTYLFVPRGVAHTFQVQGSTPARWIGIFSPGRFVGLVEELGALMPPSGPPNVAELNRLFAKYDTELDTSH